MTKEVAFLLKKKNQKYSIHSLDERVKGGKSVRY